MVTNLDPINVRHKLAAALVVHDILLGRIQCSSLIQRTAVNSNRRGRNSRYLYTVFHRTNYGAVEPITKCVNIFNTVANVFLAGHSRRLFRLNVLMQLSDAWTSNIAVLNPSSSSAASNFTV